MTLREKTQKLLEILTLLPTEREALVSILAMYPEDPLEDKMYPAVRAHIEGRYTWFFKPDGALRKAA